MVVNRAPILCTFSCEEFSYFLLWKDHDQSYFKDFCTVERQAPMKHQDYNDIRDKTFHTWMNGGKQFCGIPAEN